MADQNPPLEQPPPPPSPLDESAAATAITASVAAHEALGYAEQARQDAARDLDEAVRSNEERFLKWRDEGELRVATLRDEFSAAVSDLTAKIENVAKSLSSIRETQKATPTPPPQSPPAPVMTAPPPPPEPPPEPAKKEDPAAPPKRRAHRWI